MPSFNSIKGNAKNEEAVNYYFSSEKTKSSLITRVFGVMFISLLITAAISYGIGYAVNAAFETGNESVLKIAFVAMIVSSIGLLVMAFVIPSVMSKQGRSLIPSYIIYIGLMGVLCSSLFLEYDLSILAITFGVTAGVFAVMALLGLVSRGSMSETGTLIAGLFVGVIALSLINLFLQSNEIAWIVSFAVLAIFLFITMYDVRRIKDIANSGINNDTNIVLYCSIILYVDFIDIFIRLVYYIARFAKDN